VTIANPTTSAQRDLLGSTVPAYWCILKRILIRILDSFKASASQLLRPGHNQVSILACFIPRSPLTYNRLELEGQWLNPLTNSTSIVRKWMSEFWAAIYLGIKRFFALDHRAYEPGALEVKTKELLGLVASLVLRCDDCITYHVVQCAEAGARREEFLDTFNVALVVGGSITIPHLRRAFERMDEVLEGSKAW